MRSAKDAWTTGADASTTQDKTSKDTAIEVGGGKRKPHEASNHLSRLVVHKLTFSSMITSSILCKSDVKPSYFASDMQVKLPISASGSMLSCFKAWMASQEPLREALWGIPAVLLKLPYCFGVCCIARVPSARADMGVLASARLCSCCSRESLKKLLSFGTFGEHSTDT